MGATVKMFTGFESGNKEELGNIFSGTSGTDYSLQTTVKRTGAYALKCNPTTTGLGGVAIRSPDATGALTGGYGNDTRLQFYMYVNDAPDADSEPIATFEESSIVRMSCRIRSDRKLELFDHTDSSLGVSTTVLTLDTWYLVEIKKAYTGATWVYELRINGISEVSGSGTLQASSTALVTLGKTVNKNGEGYIIYFDDVVVATDDYVNNPFEVQCKLPSANGYHTAWTNDYTYVDEVPWGTDYCYGNVAGYRETVVCGGFTSTDRIVAAKSNCSAVRSYAGNQVQLSARSNSTDYDCSTVTLTAAITTYAQVYTSDPGTAAAWTLAGLNAFEIGFEHITGTTGNGSRWHNGQIHALFADWPVIVGTPKIAYNFGG